MKRNLILIIGIIICLFTGSALAAQVAELTLVKVVVDGEATAADWDLTADGTGANDVSGPGGASEPVVVPDTFQLSESVGPLNYTAGEWDCTGGTLVGQELTLSSSEAVTCTIVNTYDPPIVIFDSYFALPALPDGDGAGTPVCIDEGSGLLVAGCDVSDQIDPTSVQKRVDDVCAVGYSIRVINSDGSVVCEPDNDTTLSEGQVDAFVANNGYGDITAVTTAVGSGLTGGSSSGSVVLSVSGVTSAMISDNTLTANDLATNSVGAAEIATSAVGSSEVADNSLTASDLAANSVGMSELSIPAGSHNANLTMVSGYNYIYGTSTVTPPVSGSCYVTSTARVESGLTGTDGAAFLRTARQTGTSNSADYQYGVYLSGGAGSGITVTSVWSVTGGTTYKFGCQVSASGVVIGTIIYCRSAWMCF